MPSSAHSSPTPVSRRPMAAWASRSLAGVILYGRPPWRPRARAEASPALVRSTISSRSNSASAAKTPNISRPSGGVVSIVAPEPVEPPGDQGVAGAQALQARLQPGPVVALARGMVLVQPGRVHPGGEQGVALRVERLAAVRLAHPHVADQHGGPPLHKRPFSGRSRSRTHP